MYGIKFTKILQIYYNYIANIVKLFICRNNKAKAIEYMYSQGFSRKIVQNCFNSKNSEN